MTTQNAASLYRTATNAVTSGPNDTTRSTTDLVLLAGVALDAWDVTLQIVNDPASVATITGAQLIFYDTINGVYNEANRYTLSGVAIAPGTAQSFRLNLGSGISSNGKLSVTFGATPAKGTLYCEHTWRSRSGQST